MRRDVKGLGDRLWYLVRALHEKAVLRHRAADAGHVRLLKGVGSDLGERNLPGDHDHRHAVKIRRAEAGDHIGGSGAGGDEAHADLAGAARIAVGHVRATLLVTSENEPELRVRQAVENIDDRAARIAEEDFRPRLLEGFNERNRTGSFANRLHASESESAPYLALTTLRPPQPAESEPPLAASCGRRLRTAAPASHISWLWSSLSLASIRSL